jgi:hypothetical protein
MSFTMGIYHRSVSSDDGNLVLLPDVIRDSANSRFAPVTTALGFQASKRWLSKRGSGIIALPFDVGR